MQTVPANRLHHKIDLTSIERHDSFKVRNPLQSPVLIIGRREMPQLHENIDEGNVSLLVQQCRRDRAESCLKLLSVLCHRLCIPFTLNDEDEQPRISKVCSIWYGGEIMSSHTGAEKRRLALVTSSLGPVYIQAMKFQEGRDSRLFQLYDNFLTH